MFMRNATGVDTSMLWNDTEAPLFFSRALNNLVQAYFAAPSPQSVLVKSYSDVLAQLTKFHKIIRLHFDLG